MGFWKRLGNSRKIAASVALESVATTAVSDKPITVGNVGLDAAKVIVNRKQHEADRAYQDDLRRS